MVCATGAASAATPIHPHDDILALVESAALTAAMAEGLEDVEVRVQPLDARLRPARCGEPLEIARPNAGRALGPVSYGVRCPGPVPWTLYLRADVSASLELPVPRAPLPRGAVIAAADLQTVTRRITTPAIDIIVDRDEAIGMEVLRPLAAGTPIHHAQVGLPQLVSRGQTVVLVAGGQGLEVRMQGKALGNGAAGDRIQVTNTRSGRRVEGIVLADGSVRIP